MPTRFNAYRMDDGKTPLSADYFNPVFQDIDLRISDLEQRRNDLQSVIDELSKFGLQRIDVLTTRAMADMTAILAELREVREELTAGTQLAAAITAEATARDEAISGAVQGEALARAAALASEADARAQAIEQAVAQEAALRATALEQEATARNNAIAAEAQELAEAIAQEAEIRGQALAKVNEKPSGASIAYDASGRVQSITETLPTGQRVTALVYGATGRVGTVTVTFAGTTRTTSYTYDASGRVDSYVVVEG